MGESGQRYLRYHEIKVYGEAANGPNNTILLPINFSGFGGGDNERVSVSHEALMTPMREELRKSIMGKDN